MILRKNTKILHSIIINKNIFTTPEVYLSSSIILETACTVCLTKVNNNKLWYIPIYTGYGLSFYLFPFTSLTPIHPQNSEPSFLFSLSQQASFAVPLRHGLRLLFELRLVRGQS